MLGRIIRCGGWRRFAFAVGALSTGFLLAVCAAAGPRQPVPDADSQKAAVELVRSVFEEKTKRAKTPEAKRELAEEMIKTGVETQQAPATQYVVLRVARDVAMGAGDASLALSAVDELASRFEIDTLEMKTLVLGRTVKTARTREQHKQLVSVGQPVVDAAVAAERYHDAEQLLDVVLVSARKTGELSLIRELVTRKRTLATEATKFRGVAAALEVLSKNPVDAEANSTVGRYRCFVQGKWSEGLPMLALGADESTKKIAQQDIATPDELAGQVALADAWWELAKTEDEALRKAIQQRSAYWYRKALPSLSANLERQRVLQRLSNLESAAPKTTDTPPPAATKPKWISRHATYVLLPPHQKYGRPMPSLLSEDNRLYKEGFAFHSNRSPDKRIRIDLHHEMTIKGLYIRNIVVAQRTESAEQKQLFLNRAAGLMVSISKSASENGERVWTAPSVLPEWSIKLDEPVRGRFLLINLPKSNETNLHLAKVKVFGDAPVVRPGRTAKHSVLGYELREHPADAVKFGDHWYKMIYGSMSWEEAQIHCRRMGGYLVCMETEAEARFVSGMWQPLMKQKRLIWAGGVRTSNGQYRWINGAAMTHAQWQMGQPDNYAGKENRMEVDGNGKWNDIAGTGRYGRNSKCHMGFICEWEF